MTEIVLTQDQNTAFNKFVTFLMDPVETVFVLEGYSGTGKSTLVKTLLDKLPGLMKTAKLINPKYPDYEVELTATTNKAAENLAHITGSTATTIHSFLGLQVQTDYKTKTTKLVPRSAKGVAGTIIFIDEASYIDSQLLDLIFKMTRNCKIVFMGDPAQLSPVGSSGTPVFKSKFTGAKLTQVVRQAEGNPIQELSTQFRETVKTGEFFSFKPDGHHIQYMDRATFNEKIKEEFTRPDWRYSDSKILGWTNKCVISYNRLVSNNVTGSPNFQVGDYAICNSFITQGKKSIKTDQLVCITGISEETVKYQTPGRYYSIDGYFILFQPNSLEERNKRIKIAKASDDIYLLEAIDRDWVDLRAAYACTINKAQGSTYDRVFIDLDDIKRCNSGDTLARMLYVAVSRARHQVFLTGDLI